MSNIIQSNECSVCLEQYNDKRPPIVLPCGHVTCSRCTTKVNNACPECRKVFDQKATTRLFNAAEEKTEKQKLTDFAQSVTDKITKIEKLEETIKKLNQKIAADKVSCSEKHKRDKKTIDSLKAENDLLKSKLEPYEKMWSKVGVAYFEVASAIKKGKFVIENQLLTFFSGQAGKPPKFANSNKERLIYIEHCNVFTITNFFSPSSSFYCFE